MPKRTIVLLLVLVTACGCYAAPLRLQVKQIGLGNLLSRTAPVPITIEVANDSSSALNFELVVNLTSSSPSRFVPAISDNFKYPVSVGPGETRTVEFPIYLRVSRFGYLDHAPKITVDAVGEDGKSLGQTSANSDAVKLPSASHIVLLLCDSLPGRCGTYQQAIAGSGTEDQINKKSSQLQILTFGEVPAKWWAYTPADFVVVAKPLSSLSGGERQSLMEFLFSGGSVVLVEDIAGQNDWLALFRQGSPDGKPRNVGAGYLYRVQNVESPELEKIFDRLVSDYPGSYAPAFAITGYSGTYLSTSFLSRNSEHFEFPSARWLLIFLISYILLLGPISFFILRKVRKLEWGWATVTVTAIVFGVLLYSLSLGRRPKQACADEVAVYRMDHRSALADVQYAAQLSSPERVDLVVTAPGEPRLESLPVSQDVSAATEMASELTSRTKRSESFTLQMGPTTRFPVNMLRWTTRIVQWKDVRTMPGTVTTDGNGNLQNLTNVDFREAAYVDWKSGDVYLLNHVPPGATLDLNKLTRFRIQNVVAEKRAAMKDSNKQARYDLKEFLMEGRENGQMFVGLSDGPVLGVQTNAGNVRHRSTALFIVNMEQP